MGFVDFSICHDYMVNILVRTISGRTVYKIQ